MLLSLLTILFVGLKLTGFIDWSWWLVVMPTLVHVGIIIGVFVTAMAVGMRKL